MSDERAEDVEPADDIDPLDNIVALHLPEQPYRVISDDDEHAEEREQARLDAAVRKAIELHRVQGATLRASLYPRTLLAKLADGTTGRMLAMVLQGELAPTTAKEAMEVAKISDAIARANGESGPTKTDEEGRAAKLTDIGLITENLKKRARKAAKAAPELLGGVLAVPPEVDFDDFDFGDNHEEEPDAGYDPPATP